MRRVSLSSLTVLTLSAALAATLLAGCGKPGGPEPAPVTGISPAGATPESTPAGSSPTVAATDPAPVAGPEFTANGAGPYQVGGNLGTLQGDGLLAEVMTGGELCGLNTYARGVGDWADIRLSFRPDGSLYMVVNRDPAIATPSDAMLGMTLAELAGIYGAQGEELANGAARAYLVAVPSGRAVFFDLGIDGKVMAMAAADAAYLKQSYLGGTDYC